MKMSPSRSRKGSIEGYFAQHVDFKETLLFRFGGQNQTAEITCEVQIASEMATRMWDASHPFYEAARVEEGQPQDWQWKAGDKRFIANELGHMIHLADGLLVQLRNLAEKGKP